MNISFSMTTQQIRERTKDVTRRLGWSDLQPGQILTAIEKGQGLKKGEHVVKLAEITVISVKREPVKAILNYPSRELAREGFPHLTAEQFIRMFCRANRCRRNKTITRIEFSYRPRTAVFSPCAATVIRFDQYGPVCRQCAHWDTSAFSSTCDNQPIAIPARGQCSLQEYAVTLPNQTCARAYPSVPVRVSPCLSVHP
jgi:hypothetical protein